MNVLASLFGNYSKRELKRIQPICDRVLMKEDTYKDMTDEELTAQTGVLKDRLADGETLDDILPGFRPRAADAPLPGADHRRHRAPPGPDRRNENR